jgi:uncharacterized protein YcbK (DUF882 family)
MMLAAAVVAVGATLAGPRFFLAGDGRVALVNAHTEEQATVTYRRDDGSYDPDALRKIRRVMRSRDGGEGEITLRLVELLGHVYHLRGGQPLRIVSGYRSPAYNEDLRAKGRKAAGGSLHTEGLAADVAFPAKELRPLWMKIRNLDCCGAGYYQSSGFLHLDVGKPRFWEPATSKVDENLSAGNARLFARTEYDRYGADEAIVVTLHALTTPPVLVAKEAMLVDGERARPVHVDGGAGEREGCLDLPERGLPLRVTTTPAVARGRLVFRTCSPRVERTPETVETNPIEVRAAE